jgi:ankyrin repeat protein
MTPLLWAASNGAVQTAMLLLDRGASIDIADSVSYSTFLACNRSR